MPGTQWLILERHTRSRTEWVVIPRQVLLVTAQDGGQTNNLKVYKYRSLSLSFTSSNGSVPSFKCKQKHLPEKRNHQ